MPIKELLVMLPYINDPYSLAAFMVVIVLIKLKW